MNDIESKLKRLIPNSGTLDRDAVLFSAAYAAGRGAGRKPWRRVCTVLASAIVVLSFAMLSQRRLPPYAIVPAEAPAAVLPPQLEPYRPELTSYIALMRHLGEEPPTSGYPEPAPPARTLTPHSHID